MNKQTFTKEFVEAVNDIKTTKEGTYFWDLSIDDDENNWAIVLGYNNGFDEKEQDEFTDGTWRLCAKLAYQSKRSMMQCDYDIDWIMPYNENTGDVDDREMSIYPTTDLTEVADWLWKWYNDYKTALKFDGEWHFIDDLKIGYQTITGLSLNEDGYEMTDEEIREYMKEALTENGDYDELGEFGQCQWCEEFMDKSQLTKELNLGYLCDGCIGAIKSRGEKLYLEV